MTRILPLVLATLVCAAQVLGQTFKDLKTIPESPACKRGVEIVNVVNSGDGDRVAAYVREHFAPAFRDQFPMDDHRAAFLELHRNSRSLEIYGARTYEPPRPANQAVIVCRNTLAETWMAVSVEVEEAPPHRVTRLEFPPARPPADQPPQGPLTRQEATDQLGAYIDRLAAAGVFSGTAILAKDGKVLMSRAAGVANRDFDVPVNIDTKFNLGSMNKMMTGVAIMQLVEQGKLSLDDSLAQHLGDDWLPKVDKRKVKVVHLLTHTSGLGSYFNDAWERSSRSLYRNIDDWKPVVAEETLAFEPGTRSSYSNTGMLIAGAVIEKVSGMRFDDYVREYITGPAGMADTGFFELDRVNKNLAVGYEPDGKGYRNNVFVHVIKGGPAGGGYSTVGDLLKFDVALRSGKLLKPASLEVLWSAKPEIASPEYGLGFGVSASPLGKVVGHSGGFTGISGTLSMFLDSGYTIAVLGNFGGATRPVEERAAQLLMRVQE